MSTSAVTPSRSFFVQTPVFSVSPSALVSSEYSNKHHHHQTTSAKQHHQLRALVSSNYSNKHHHHHQRRDLPEVCREREGGRERERERKGPTGPRRALKELANPQQSSPASGGGCTSAPPQTKTIPVQACAPPAAPAPAPPTAPAAPSSSAAPGDPLGSSPAAIRPVIASRR